jgi:hypothetical protein
MNLCRRAFMVAGAGALALPAPAAISDAVDRIERRKRIKVKASKQIHQPRRSSTYIVDGF